MQSTGFTRSLQLKSKFDAEFRRFSIDTRDVQGFQALYILLERIHGLYNIPFVVQYIDPKEGDILPINNDKNYEHACKVSKVLLRILLQRKGESYGEINGYRADRSLTLMSKNPASTLRSMGAVDKPRRSDRANISLGGDFHLVSSILDVHLIPRTMRRVRLVRSRDKPFGLLIRSGPTIRFNENGREEVPGCFVSRLLEKSIAADTGLLAVDDEIIEVNGIEVYGKTVDQVADMMIANSSNLIITVKPANQNHCLDRPPRFTAMHQAATTAPGIRGLPAGPIASQTTLASTPSPNGGSQPTLSSLAQRDRDQPRVGQEVRSNRTGSATSHERSLSAASYRPSNTDSLGNNTQMREIGRPYQVHPAVSYNMSGNGKHDLMVDDLENDIGAGLITL